MFNRPGIGRIGTAQSIADCGKRRGSDGNLRRGRQMQTAENRQEKKSDEFHGWVVGIALQRLLGVTVGCMGLVVTHNLGKVAAC